MKSDKDYSKDRFILHPKRGIKMEIQANSWIKFCIGMAILLLGFGIFFLLVTPIVKVLFG